MRNIYKAFLLAVFAFGVNFANAQDLKATVGIEEPAEVIPTVATEGGVIIGNGGGDFTIYSVTGGVVVKGTAEEGEKIDVESTGILIIQQGEIVEKVIVVD